MKYAIALTAAALLCTPAQAQPLRPGLAGMAFLIGDWSSGNGHVADTGGTSAGTSSITSQAGGAVLLRRDHADLFDAAGHPSGGFDILMTIYAGAGTIHADYFDPQHTIHYTSAIVQPGRSVTFLSPAAAGAPAFRLTYRVAAADAIAIDFGMVPPGGTGFHPIATGIMKRVR